MPKPINEMEWPDIAALVQCILAARKVSITKKSTRGDVEVKTIETRPMRFKEFSDEIKENYRYAYRWINGGMTPAPKAKAKIIAWCERHRHHIGN